mmetsp:Transcript_4932/g.5065  ORF Transcript_4932/g.5065 Transcript_4932/m.5065 type:complete len:185 (+) Transcript_4932:10-564(+)
MECFVSGFPAKMKTGGHRMDRKSAIRHGMVSMLIHPNKNLRKIEHLEIDKPPKKYIWNEKAFGSLKPGTAGDNFPLETIAEVWKGMQLQEFDRDEVAAEITDPDEDFLEMIAASGRLVLRTSNDDEVDEEYEKIRAGITEEDLDFDGEEEEALSYYTRSENGASFGQDPYQAEYGYTYDGAGNY